MALSDTVPTPLDVSAVLPDGMHLIGGQWASAAAGETIEVINPANGERIADIPRGGAEDVQAAINAAAEAYPAWRDMNPSRRGALMFEWARLCREHEAELDMIERMEVGRPHWGGTPTAGIIQFTAGIADKVFGQTLPAATPDVLGFTLREPHGVCGVIIPWNAPAMLFGHNVAPAIAMGNTVVVKPAEDAPLMALLLAKLALEAGIPAGVINVVCGYGAEAGDALSHNPGIRHMSFTGSPQTGKAVMRACAENFVPVHLELGGKSPQIVLPDAPLEKAINTIVFSITQNTGQICAAGSRVVVPEVIREQLVEGLAERMEKVTVGPWHEKVNMGPLINAKQQDRVLDYLDIGREEGAKVVTGGSKLTGAGYDGGFFVAPTLFDGVTPEMRIAQEEIFGPVLSVLSANDEEEALVIANNTEYGLVASVWTSDVGRAVRLARRVQAGQVAINTLWSGGVIGAPFGGYKSSGFGRNVSVESMLEYTQTKTVIIDATA